MTKLKKFRVWDPESETLEHARTISAISIAAAAEQYAESDAIGQGEGLYTGNGHALHVLDEDADAHECIVTLELVPSYEGQVRRRL
jgi:hypothetical protein